MTIWILTILMLASLAGLGYRQGAIRAGFSLAGIILGGLLAVPVGGLLKSLLPKIGVTNPVLLWGLGPLLVFALLLTIFKVAGSIVHKKVEMYYKYKSGELRLALWERLVRHTGLCLGIVNATAYLVLLSLVIYLVGYWTFQLATPESDSWKLKVVNRLGEDLDKSGFDKVAASVDKSSDAFFGLADLAGLVFQSPGSERRLSGYPSLLELSEEPKFQELGRDQEFTQLRQAGGSIEQLLASAKAQEILNNRALMERVEAAVVPNLQDITNFMQTAVSKTFGSEPILGRWAFEPTATGTLLRTEKNLSANQAAQMRRAMSITYAAVLFVATPNHKIFLKNLPRVAPGMAAPELYTAQGEWSGGNGDYQVTLSADGRTLRMQAKVTGSRLNLTGEDPPMAFLRVE